MTQAAGWYPDPYGRFQERHWDGTSWTARVRTGTDETVDPLGVTTSIPFAIPASALPPKPRGVRRFVAWLRRIGRMVRRPS